MASSSQINKYAVVGLGCIGGVVGILLGLSNYDVSFIGRKSERFGGIEERKALSLMLPDGKREAQILKTQNITSDFRAGLEGRNVILVATKRSVNQSIAKSIAEHAAEGALVIMLQNGLDASKEMLEAFEQENRKDLIVIDSVVNLNVVELKPGEFEWVTSRADSCVAVDGSRFGMLAEERFCAALRAAGLDSYAEEKFLEIATGKLLINLINAPNALAGCDTQEMLTTPEYRKVWGATVREARAVFRAMGIKQRAPRNHNNFIVQNLEYITGAPSFLVAIIARTKKTKGGKTSMLQDFENKTGETEINYITGYIVEKGKELNVETPVSSKLVELVKLHSAKREGSPQMSPKQLADAVGLSEASSCVIC